MVSIIKSKLLEKRVELARAKSLNKNESGVTIVELMIVVAVASLLLVLVLVAAPALQRSGANATRRNDIGAIRGQLQAVATNNNGVLPDAIAAEFGAKVLGQIDPSIYTAAAYTLTASAVASSPNTVYYIKPTTPAVIAATANLPTPDSIHILAGLKCGATALPDPGAVNNDSTVKYGGADTDVANSRVFAIIFQLEGETQPRCEDNS